MVGVVKDSVFEGVLSELPLNAMHVEIEVSYSYKSIDGNHKGSVKRYFPSKAEATFRRETAKAEDAIKKLGAAIEKAVRHVDSIESSTHGRLNKLERKNDPNATKST